MAPELLVIIVGVTALLSLPVVVLFVAARFVVRVRPDQAIVVSTPRGIQIKRVPTFVLPVIHHAELVELAPKTIALSRRGKEALSDREGVRVEIDVRFEIAVEPSDENILRFVQAYGAAASRDGSALRERLMPKLSEALASAVVWYDLEHLRADREHARERVIEQAEHTLDGWVVRDFTFVSIEQAPLSAHDPDDARDARGIRTITERTVPERARELELLRDHRVRAAQLRTDTEVMIADMFAWRTRSLKLIESGGEPIDFTRIERELDDRVRKLIDAERDLAASKAKVEASAREGDAQAVDA